MRQLKAVLPRWRSAMVLAPMLVVGLATTAVAVVSPRTLDALALLVGALGLWREAWSAIRRYRTGEPAEPISEDSFRSPR